MHPLVYDAILNADFCEMMGDVHYSTNPRDYVTLEEMEQEYADREIREPKTLH